MSPIQETLFDLLLNAILQIGFFAVVVVFFSRLVAKAKAKHQYCFYVTALLFCLAVPVINTLWQSPSVLVVEKSQHQDPTEAGGPNRPFLELAGPF